MCTINSQSRSNVEKGLQGDGEGQTPRKRRLASRKGIRQSGKEKTSTKEAAEHSLGDTSDTHLTDTEPGDG